MKTRRDAERFFCKFFPDGHTEIDDNGELIFHTGTKVTNGALVPFEDSEEVREKPLFGKYKGD